MVVKMSLISKPGKYLRMYAGMLMRRDPGLIVFGAWLGERFADNSKELFLEAQAREGIRAVWVAKEQAVIDEINSLGFEAYLWGSPEARSIQQRAGYAVISNGISDLEHT